MRDASLHFTVTPPLPLLPMLSPGFPPILSHLTNPFLDHEMRAYEHETFPPLIVACRCEPACQVCIQLWQAQVLQALQIEWGKCLRVISLSSRDLKKDLFRCGSMAEPQDLNIGRRGERAGDVKCKTGISP